MFISILFLSTTVIRNSSLNLPPFHSEGATSINDLNQQVLIDLRSKIDIVMKQLPQTDSTTIYHETLKNNVEKTDVLLARIDTKIISLQSDGYSEAANEMINYIKYKIYPMITTTSALDISQDSITNILKQLIISSNNINDSLALLLSDPNFFHAPIEEGIIELFLPKMNLCLQTH